MPKGGISEHLESNKKKREMEGIKKRRRDCAIETREKGPFYLEQFVGALNLTPVPWERCQGIG